MVCRDLVLIGSPLSRSNRAPSSSGSLQALPNNSCTATSKICIFAKTIPYLQRPSSWDPFFVFRGKYSLSGSKRNTCYNSLAVSESDGPMTAAVRTQELSKTSQTIRGRTIEHQGVISPILPSDSVKIHNPYP